jgi:hypothetical protein
VGGARDEISSGNERMERMSRNADDAGMQQVQNKHTCSFCNASSFLHTFSDENKNIYPKPARGQHHQTKL